MIRDKGCGELRESDIGSNLSLAGWVFRRRDHGGPYSLTSETGADFARLYSVLTLQVIRILTHMT